MWEYKIFIGFGVLLEIIGVLLLVERSRELLVNFFKGEIPPQPNRETKSKLKEKQGYFVIIIIFGAFLQILGLIMS